MQFTILLLFRVRTSLFFPRSVILSGKDLSKTRGSQLSLVSRAGVSSSPQVGILRLVGPLLLADVLHRTSCPLDLSAKACVLVEFHL